ncbi:MAG: 23S rRNA (adenine(2503)-C(2))-methyltransferase RlmN, partial [Clostridia bacterium]|nr:23S rRNA (adenine(2503)-C(2))-methyltransferase RlmN [Clostridia bacterium]
MPDEKKLSLQDLSEKRLAEVLSDYPAFRAQQVYLAAMQYKEYSQMTNLPKDIIAFLAERYDDIAVRIQKVFEGKDGTEKYLFLLRDGNMIEGVFMPHGYGNTICISTQVGCRMGCAFCASTLNGLVRNLTAGEMLGQVLAVN